MSIFGNKKKRSTYMGEPIGQEPTVANYDQVVDFLVSVNDKDYQKIIKVANIYRDANVEVAKATGVKQEPVQSIFARQTVPAVNLGDQPGHSFLDEDDELVKAFAGSEPDEPEVKPTTKPKKGRGSK